MNYKAVIFDLDGTLLDTIDDLADSMNSILSASGLPVHDREAYKYFVGNGMRNLVFQALPQSLRDEVNVKRYVKLMEKTYQANCDIKTRPYEGITELLEALHSKGKKVSILSNKPDPLTRLTVESYFPGHKFEYIFGERSGVPRKPDPAGALEISSELGIPPEEFIYIGDTGVDMKTAKAAGMYAVGALWGFRKADELLENGASILIKKPLDLLEIIG
jgi:phosphoglycolate phosphatase